MALVIETLYNQFVSPCYQTLRNPAMLLFDLPIWLLGNLLVVEVYAASPLSMDQVILLVSRYARFNESDTQLPNVELNAVIRGHCFG